MATPGRGLKRDSATAEVHEKAPQALTKAVGREKALTALCNAMLVCDLMSAEGVIALLCQNFIDGAMPDMLHAPGGFPLLICFAMRLAFAAVSARGRKHNPLRKGDRAIRQPHTSRAHRTRAHQPVHVHTCNPPARLSALSAGTREMVRASRLLAMGPVNLCEAVRACIVRLSPCERLDEVCSPLLLAGGA